MAFSYVGGAQSSGPGSTASITHGLTINSGDLVTIYINANDAGAIGTPTGGTTFTTLIDETPAGETANQMFAWKIAGASEPTSYSSNLTTSRDYKMIIKVFSSSSDAEIDSAINSAKTTTKQLSMDIHAVQSQTVSNGCVSIVAGGKDTAALTETYTTATDSYTGVIGDTDAAGGRASVMAHRIFTTDGKTFGASDIVDIDTADANDGRNDFVYSIHVSFVESGGAPAATPRGLMLMGVGS